MVQAWSPIVVLAEPTAVACSPTDSIPGNILMWTELPHSGLPVHAWPG